jgi:FMNH2-dependent dimethyl sulfone monooxygenase
MADISLDQRRSFFNDSALKIGLFGSNCSSGRAVTLADDRWSGEWDDNVRMAQAADAAGLDFLLPIARWKGAGGETDYQGSTLETVTWATGLLAKTKNISVFATMHVPLIHPIIAAKQMVTADHIGEGRFGLNVVVGWNEDEFEMFGVDMRAHDTRYDYAQEWLDAVMMMWQSEDDFDLDGKFIKLKKVRSKPKPYGGSRPLIMNAGGSPAGTAFALRNCDAFFKSVNRRSLDSVAQGLREFRSEADKIGRTIDTFSICVICCRRTQKEAEEFMRDRMETQGDWQAVENRVRLMTPGYDALPEAERAALRTGFVRSNGLQIIGDPDMVAGELAKLHHAGLRGAAVTLYDYAGEIPFLAAELLPRLKRMGLRA